MTILKELFDVIDKVKSIPKEMELDAPGGFNVMILNNPVTPAEVVVEALMSSVGLSKSAAMKRMMRTHRNGWHCVATYSSKDVAETVANKIEKHAGANTNYDHYRKYVKFNDPWPLDTEIMEADGS